MASMIRNRTKNFSNRDKTMKKRKPKKRQRPGVVGKVRCSATGREAHGPIGASVRGGAAGAVWEAA